jgi:glycosyltransferase involved in cell wall biosynthesis
VAPLSKICNINNAIDFDEGRQLGKVKAVRDAFGVGENDLVIGAIGRLTSQKGWITFLYVAKEIIRYHRQVKFFIIGDGEMKQELRHLVKVLDIQDYVVMTGHVQEIHKIYSMLDIVVNTSEWEGLPYVFLEAMHFGLPIVATNTGNDAAIVNGRTGYIAAIKDYKAIAKLVMELIINTEARTAMGRAGFIHLKEKYSFKAFLSRHEELYLSKDFNPAVMLD